MKLNKLILSCGMISTLTLGALGTNTHAEESIQSNNSVSIVKNQVNTEVQGHKRVKRALRLTQIVNLTGEGTASFVYMGHHTCP